MDINNIFDKAKQELMKQGCFTPILFVEFFKAGPIQTLFADFPEDLHQQHVTMFDAGRQVGQERYRDGLRQVCFVAEAWASDNLDIEPRHDAKRTAGLFASVLDIENKTVRQSAHFAEIVRAGGSIDLLESREIDGDEMLLQGFLAGFVSSKMSDGELGAFVKDFFARKS
jgi:hypothetical protein